MESREATSLKQSTIAIGDTELTYLRGGRGRVLLYLHGGDGLAPSGQFLDLLAGHFDVIAPVHPGFDHSQFPDWMDCVDDYAHLYVTFLDKLGINHALMAGISLGGWIAAEIVTKNRSRIDQLVMIAPVGVKTGSPDRLDIPDIFAMREARLHQILYHEPDKWETNASTKTDEELRAIARNRETLAMMTWEPYMHNPKLRHRLSSVDIPVLFVRGQSDGLVSHDYFEAYRRLFPVAFSIIIPEAGHVPHLEQPEALATIIGNFAENARAQEMNS